MFSDLYALKHLLQDNVYNSICIVCGLLQMELMCHDECPHRQNVVSRLIEGAE